MNPGRDDDAVDVSHERISSCPGLSVHTHGVLSYWFAISFIIHQAFLITSNVNLTKKRKRRRKKAFLAQFEWSHKLSPSAPCWWHQHSVINLITPLDSTTPTFPFFKKTNKQRKRASEHAKTMHACTDILLPKIYWTQTSPQADRETLIQS